MIRQFTTFCLFATLTFAYQAKAKVCINEVMQSNVTTLFVEYDYPDSWLELYNSDNSDYEISGWKVGLDKDPATAYTLPAALSIPANGHLLVLCDKNGEGLHTDFRIDSGKGNVYLFDASGNIVETVKLAKMPAPDIAYGRTSDGADDWAYFVASTPGSSNVGATSSELLPEPVFSCDSQICSSPLTFEISIPDDAPEGTMLAITTDGSYPTEPMPDSSCRLTVYESTVVRARLLNDLYLSPLAQTRSYIFPERETELPIFSIVTDNDHLYSMETGILYGNEEDENPNYNQEWRRPLNIEYFSKSEHKPLINQIGEMRVHGGQTRQQPQKSLAIYANKRFVTKRFDTSDFWDAKPEIKIVKSFLLRNGGNDFINAHMRDAFIQESMAEGFGGIDYQAYQPAIVYINGKYKGIYDIRERSNEDYVEANYNGLEDIDMFENIVSYKAGDPRAYLDLLRVTNRDNCTYDELEAIFDKHSMLSNLATAIYANHDDFMPNNTVIWRSATVDNNRWRFLAKDFDNTLGRFYITADKNYFDFLNSRFDHEDYYIRNVSSPYKVVIRTEEGRKALTQYILFLLGEIMQPAASQDKFLAMESKIVAEMESTYKTYNSPSLYNVWLEASGTDGAACKWLRERPKNLVGHVGEQFGLGEPFELTIDRNGEDATLYGLRMYRDKFVGYGFNGIGLDLSNIPGHSWKVDATLASGDKVCSGPFNSLENYVAPADTKSLAVTLVDGAGILDIDTSGELTEYFTLDGVSLGFERPAIPGIYILRRGSSASRFFIR